MTQTQQKSLISIVFILLIAGLIVSLNVDNQDTQSSVSVITPSNTNTSVDNHAQVTPSNNTNNTNTNPQANTNQTH
jgi:choline-glycine betaine transporter